MALKSVLSEKEIKKPPPSKKEKDQVKAETILSKATPGESDKKQSKKSPLNSKKQLRKYFPSVSV